MKIKAACAEKRCKSSLVRCWAVQNKISKKNPRTEPADKKQFLGNSRLGILEFLGFWGLGGIFYLGNSSLGNSSLGNSSLGNFGRNFRRNFERDCFASLAMTEF